MTCCESDERILVHVLHSSVTVANFYEGTVCDDFYDSLSRSICFDAPVVINSKSLISISIHNEVQSNMFDFPQEQ